MKKSKIKDIKIGSSDFWFSIFNIIKNRFPKIYFKKIRVAFNLSLLEVISRFKSKAFLSNKEIIQSLFTSYIRNVKKNEIESQP